MSVPEKIQDMINGYTRQQFQKNLNFQVNKLNST